MGNEEFEGLSKKERRELRRQQKEEERNARVKQKQRKKWIIRGSIALVFVVAIYFLFIHKPDVSGQGVLRITEQTYDFGAVSLLGGTVSAEIPLVNIGEGDLTITGLDSSCGCTTASIINNGQESPIFQMASHGRNPQNWKTTIASGDQASLKVYYNPAVHPDFRGPVTRVVTVFSDDPLQSRQQVRVKVNQVD